MRWMVCRVPVVLQIATGDDARSLRPPALLPAKRRACGAATPIVLQVQGVMTRAIGDQPGHPCHESRHGDDPPRPALPALARSGCTNKAVRARKTRPCRRAPLMCAAAAPARSDRPGLGYPVALLGATGVTGVDGSENAPNSDLGVGGRRSGAAAHYSSAASPHGAECLALTD